MTSSCTYLLSSPITPTGRGASIDVERYVRTMREYSKTMKEMFRKWKGFVNIVPPKAMEAVVLGQTLESGNKLAWGRCSRQNSA